ncbi:MAG TPA: hypothetical protein VFJ79_05120, partial [Acidimicrobiales bacterium]|nr:hypothetical protein [Acidimicrobiales bacterium]
QYIQSLFIVLIVYIWGVSTPGAALAGALSLALAPQIAIHLPTRFTAVTYFMTGFGALGLVLRPEGIIASTGERFRETFARLPGFGHSTLPPPEVTHATVADA